MVMDPEAQPLTSDPTRGRVIIGNHFFIFFFFVSVFWFYVWLLLHLLLFLFLIICCSFFSVVCLCFFVSLFCFFVCLLLCCSTSLLFDSPPARWGLLDFIRAVLLLRLLTRRLLLAVQIPVGTAGPSPRTPAPSGHSRTSTASSRSQRGQPDLHRELCQRECQKICQKICQIKCHEICHVDRMSEAMPDRMPERMS